MPTVIPDFKHSQPFNRRLMNAAVTKDENEAVINETKQMRDYGPTSNTAVEEQQESGDRLLAASCPTTLLQPLRQKRSQGVLQSQSLQNRDSVKL